MKKINKQSQPTELQQWIATNSNYPSNLCYEGGGFPREYVLKALLKEQGYLCAYTLLRISIRKAHIEHLKPQCLCKAEDEDLVARGKAPNREDIAWKNLVACFPEPNAPSPNFGAVYKGKWWHQSEFISPLARNCENRFKYKMDGSISPKVSYDVSAQKTITNLNLDCDRLRELRFTAIKQAGLHIKSENPIKSTNGVKSFVQQLSIMSTDGYPEFCTVLEQVSSEYITKLQKIAQHRKHRNTGKNLRK